MLRIKPYVRKVYKAYISRASEVGITSTEFDNKAIMDEILV